MSSKLIGLAFCFMIFGACSAQEHDQPLTLDPAFDATIRSYLNFTVPILTCEALYENRQNYLILDAREKVEFEVSHLENAVFVGYKEFDYSKLAELEKNKPIVVYCSIGYRSEKIGEKLKSKGFTQVYNLYGSIFEWANRDFPLVDNDGQQTRKIHTYNKKWSKWVEGNGVEKIW